jgi:Nif-specific regulatory protein
MNELDEPLNMSCIRHRSKSGVDSGKKQISNACRIIRDLALLFEISQMIIGNTDLRAISRPLLKKLCETIGATRGMIHIINRETSRIPIEESFGMSGKDLSEFRSKMEDGLVGKAIRSGKPVVAANLNKDDDTDSPVDPLSFHGGDDSVVVFYCLPVHYGRDTCGTLSIERILHTGESTKDDLRLLSLVASVLAQVVSLKQNAQEQMESLRRENERLQEQMKNNFKPPQMIGSSSAMHSVYLHIEQVAPSSNTTVLIRGESGVGKELVASAIHKNSGRCLSSFVKINCAALPDSIIESELFGHEKGAFTGAISMRKGRFEIAEGGTIFLDEIGDISPQTQVKLLRVLQEREFERVGGQPTIRCNVRVIAATSRNLEQLIEQNKFRPDLYYRLNVFPIYVPPLRERKSDILQLADYFVEKYARIAQKQIRRISPAAIELLMGYGWPGNVRELENSMERAVLLCSGDTIHAHHLPMSLQSIQPSLAQSGGLLERSLGALERELMIDCLKSSQGNMAAAARLLGITERMMGLRMKKYQIDASAYSRPGEKGALPLLAGVSESV